MLLDAPVPMWLAWGPELAMVYNEAYSRMLGGKHPRALGAPLADVWAEIWGEVGGLVRQTLAGHALYQEDLPLVVNRNGHDEQTWFSFSYAPLRDDEEDIQGLVCTVWETTDKVRGQRRLAQSESQLRALTMASTGVIYRMSADWAQLLELNGQGFIADTTAPRAGWADNYVPPDELPRVNAAIRQAIGTRSTFEL